MPDSVPKRSGPPFLPGSRPIANHGNLFLKRFPYHENADYPDFGCNFETFTRQDMLEVESLGPLVTLAGGDSVHHPETWYLVPDARIPEDDDSCGAWLADLASSRPLHETSG